MKARLRLAVPINKHYFTREVYGGDTKFIPAQHICNATSLTKETDAIIWLENVFLTRQFAIT